MEIKIEHLNKAYGKRQVLKDISLRIPAGIYGLLGKNGTGKSTLLRILSTLSEPDSGSVQINGFDISQKKEIRRIIDDCYEGALGILKNNFQTLSDIARRLMEQETLLEEELDQIIGKRKISPPSLA